MQKESKLNQINNIDFGKLPPQATELEEAVLGGIMLDKDSIIIVSGILQPESFYKDAHQKIYTAILSLFSRNSPIDILTVTSELKSLKMLEEVGGPYYVAQLTNRVASTANIEYHSLIIDQFFKKREIIRICSESLNKAYDDSLDYDDILQDIDKEFIKLNSNITSDSVEKINSIVKKKLIEIEKIQKGEIELSGIPSKLTKIDSKTCGWQNSDLIIIGARPSMGKTAFALKLAIEASLSGYPSIYFSLEMSKDQLSLRTIARESGFTQMELKTGRFDNWSQIERGVKKIDGMDLYINDTASLHINKLKSLCYTYYKKFKVRLIIIDYLQLVKGSNPKFREQEISEISRTLKLIAKDLNVPVIALSQLNRAVEGRADKKPNLSDLRESGSIEQDADMVLFLRRDEIYNKDDESLQLKTQIDCPKHRNGSIFEIELSHNVGLTDYRDNSEEFNDIPVPKDYGISPNRNFEIDKTPF